MWNIHYDLCNEQHSGFFSFQGYTVTNAPEKRANTLREQVRNSYNPRATHKEKREKEPCMRRPWLVWRREELIHSSTKRFPHCQICMYQPVAWSHWIDRITKERQRKTNDRWSLQLQMSITSCNHAESPQIALINSVASAVGFKACSSATCHREDVKSCYGQISWISLSVVHDKTYGKHDVSADGLLAPKQRYSHRQRFPEIISCPSHRTKSVSRTKVCSGVSLALNVSASYWLPWNRSVCETDWDLSSVTWQCNCRCGWAIISSKGYFATAHYSYDGQLAKAESTSYLREKSRSYVLTEWHSCIVVREFHRSVEYTWRIHLERRFVSEPESEATMLIEPVFVFIRERTSES